MIGSGIFLVAALLSTPPVDVVAHVNDVAITSADVAARVAAQKAAGIAARPADALQSLIDDALLAAEGERLRLAEEPQAQQALEKLRRELAAQRFLEKEIYSQLVVQDEHLRSLYHAGVDEARLDMIVVATRDEAQGIVDRLAKGGKFAEEVRRSLDPNSASKGGDTGFMLRMNLQRPIAELAFSAPIGVLQGPVALGAGFGVFRIRERRVGDEKGFAAKRAELVQYATGQVRDQAKAHFIEKQRAKLKIVLDEAFLDRSGVSLRASPSDADHPIAKVGHTVIRYGDVLQDVAAVSRGAQGAHASGPAVKKEFASQRVNAAVLQEEALSSGYGDDPGVKARLAEERRTMVAYNAAMRLRDAASASEEEVQAYYKANAAQFQRGARRDCSHLLAPSREDATALRKKIAAGEAFEDVARRESKDGRTASAGGHMGEVDLGRVEALTKGPDAALATALLEAKPGELSAPVRSAAGWHLVRCGPKTPAGPAPLAEVRDEIVKRVRAAKADQALRTGIAALRARAHITIDERKLETAAASAR